MIALLVITTLILIFITLLIVLKEEMKLFSLLVLLLLVIACAAMDLNIQQYKLYPVDYTVVKTPVKIIVVTDYGTFESDKLIDNENWSKNSTWYIIKAYDYFGHEDFKEFTTTPYDKNINYTNEHR